MSDTPETDAVEFPVMTWPSRDNPMVIRSNLARKLERERDESRKLADDAMATLREIKDKYGLGDRHVMREKNREIEKLREALKFVATDKIANAADMRWRAAHALVSTDAKTLPKETTF